MIALSLKDIELGLKSPMQSFPSIKLKSVAGWEYACLSQNTVEGCFLEGKLLKKLEIFFIPDPAAVNVHEKTPVWRTRLKLWLLPRPRFYRVTWKQGPVAFPAWHLFCKSIPTILPLNEQLVLWFTFDTQAKKLTTDKAF